MRGIRLAWQRWNALRSMRRRLREAQAPQAWLEGVAMITSREEWDAFEGRAWKNAVVERQLLRRNLSPDEEMLVAQLDARNATGMAIARTRAAVAAREAAEVAKNEPAAPVNGRPDDFVA